MDFGPNWGAVDDEWREHIEAHIAEVAEWEARRKEKERRAEIVARTLPRLLAEPQRIGLIGTEEGLTTAEFIIAIAQYAPEARARKIFVGYIDWIMDYAKVPE